jgi:ribokinase
MSEAFEVVVVGSLNIDIVVPVPHLPIPGETVPGSEHLKTLGGKGANQAVAAARLGRRVVMVGRVGADAEGDACVSGLNRDRVSTQYVVRDHDVPTGVALIAVDPSGENSIVVGPGSNAHLDATDVRAAGEALSRSRVTLVQLEIPMEAVLQTVELAEGTVILNPAPAKPLPQEVLRHVHVLTPNEIELGMLSGRDVGTQDELIAAARSIEGPRAVAVTLGHKGVLLVTHNNVISIPAATVTVVDTTAAGDAFCGALADALARGEQLEDAARWAVTAASISVTRLGAQPSLPTVDEVRTMVSKGRSSGN